MFPQNSLLSDLSGDRIPLGTIAYVGQRAKNSYYSYVIDKFRDANITKADLARRIGKEPARVNRLLANPGNWTIETIAELLAGICAEEVVPDSLPFAGRPPRNGGQADLLSTGDKIEKTLPPPPTQGLDSAVKVRFLENVP